MDRLTRDLLRILPLLAVASLLLWSHGSVAQYFGRPELGAWGMYGALALYGCALIPVLLRIYFPNLNGHKLASKAEEQPLGAAIVYLTRGIVLAALILSMSSLVRAEPLPANAATYAPVLLAEQRAHWPTMPDPTVLMAQVEKETCISLKHPKCWTPMAELRTARERGVGFGQITKTARFDSLAELRSQYPVQLAGWGWDSPTLYDPAYQMRGLVLMDMRNYGVFRSTKEPLSFMLAAYNGGVGGTLGEIALCRGTPGCDADRWFGHVEHTSKKAKVAADGYGQGFFYINRGYVSRIMIRSHAYAGLV